MRGLASPPALVGFDDFELADLLDITVIGHSPERMGEIGADLVLARLGGNETPAHQERLPTELIVRGSGERRAGKTRESPECRGKPRKAK
jgi:LacI family transcriptional regulator